MLDFEQLAKQLTAKWINRTFINDELKVKIIQNGEKLTASLVPDSVQTKASVMANSNNKTVQCTFKLKFLDGEGLVDEEYLCGIHPGWTEVLKEYCNNENIVYFTLLPYKGTKTVHLVITDRNDGKGDAAIIRRWHPSLAGSTFAVSSEVKERFDNKIRAQYLKDVEDEDSKEE